MGLGGGTSALLSAERGNASAGAINRAAAKSMRPVVSVIGSTAVAIERGAQTLAQPLP